MKRLYAFAAVMLLCLSACDWDQSALLNGISIRRNVPKDRTMNVYLAVDGVSFPAMEKARLQGAFKGYAFAKSIPMFPATSDASWSRILHAPQFGGYEYTHYDEAQDKVVNPGLGGIITHSAPHPEGSDSFPYYDAFDLHGSGYGDGVEKYAAPESTWKAALDQLFIVLDGRMATQDTFIAYMLETDVIGHYEDDNAVVALLVQLSNRIEDFKARHKDVQFKFTLLSDHGLDGVRKAKGHFVSSADIVTDVGVTPADSFADARKRKLDMWAVASEHTRVTYGTLNTVPELVSEVARRVSTSEFVDLVVAKAEQPENAPTASQWVSLFLAGNEVLRYGFDPDADAYWLPANASYGSLDVSLKFQEPSSWQAFSDEDLFLATVDRRYPDLFFRARTSLLPISVKNTAQILFSLREEYALKGFSLPFADDSGAASSHGAMGGRGSQGILLTEERDLPGVVRSENIIEMFPRFKERLEKRMGGLHPGDPNAGLDEARLPRPQ